MEKKVVQYLKEAGPTMLCILGVVWLFGKVIESNVDVEKNWLDYIESKKKKQT